MDRVKWLPKSFKTGMEAVAGRNGGVEVLVLCDGGEGGARARNGDG